MKIVSKYGDYEVIIKENCLNNIDKYVKLEKALIITEKNIPKEYITLVKKAVNDCYIFISIAGEKAKSLENYYKIIEFLKQNNFSRSDYIIALGGGVITDLAGFVSATYMRGIKYINIPTTTLAMVDASIGGKTALNFQGIKNMIGAFYPPVKVIIDFKVLDTLERRPFNEGLVEALKCGYIYDKSILELFNKVTENLNEIIEKAILTKKAIVEKDEKENGIRKILNFGHTYGHALESYSNYKYYHGECVAYGMYLFLADDLKEKYLYYLKQLDIDITLMPESKKLKPYLKNDKKATKDSIDVIQVQNAGQAIIKRIKIDSL